MFTSLRLHDEHLSNKPNRQYSDALIHGSPTSDAPRSQPHTSKPAANPRNTCPQEPLISVPSVMPHNTSKQQPPMHVSSNILTHARSQQPRMSAQIDRVSQNYQQQPRMSAHPRMLAAVVGGQQHLIATMGIPPRYAPPQNRQSKQMPMRTNENLNNDLTATIHNYDYGDDFELPRQVRRKYNQKENRRRREITGTANKDCRARGAPEPSRHLFISRIASETNINDLHSDISVQYRDLACVSHNEAKFKSFKLTVPKSEFGDLFHSRRWAEGFRVRPYITPRSGIDSLQIHSYLHILLYTLWVCFVYVIIIHMDWNQVRWSTSAQ